MNISQNQLLKQIAALPSTTVVPYRLGGGVSIYHQVSSAHIKITPIWLDRPRTVQYLQDYLQNRQGV